MALAMSRPWRDPGTGIWYLRKRVPKSLVPLVGRPLVKRSLGTKDSKEAKCFFPAALAKLESEWASIRADAQSPPPAAEISTEPTCFPKSLTEREAHERAAWVFDYVIRVKGAAPQGRPSWDTSVFDRLWPELDTAPFDIYGRGIEKTDRNPKPYQTILMRDWCLKQADEVAWLRDWALDEPSRIRLARAIGVGAQRAHLTLARLERGEVGPEAVFTNGTFPSRDPMPNVTETAKVTLTQILEDWWREAKAAGRKPSTYESYRNTTSNLIRFLKHDDATLVTPANVVAFKDHRLATPSQRTGKVPSAKTVKDSDLSALKTLFGWAVVNQKLPMNPALGLTIKLGKTPRLRPKGFVDAEANAILSAAYQYSNDREQRGTADAKRWVPWLCAFTGARVGEMGQLRRKDVRRYGEVWVIHITPEAGTQKTNEARDVPLHPQLIEIGFPAFVEACPEGPLFLTPARNGDVLGPLQGLKNRLAEFGRGIVPDPGVAPNHGWRHRFKTVGLEAGIDSRVLNAIQGQAAQSVADTYGEVTLKTMAAAISKLPYFEIKPSATRAGRWRPR